MAQIIEIKKIVDIFNYVDDKTLVVFDIDNTLIDTVQAFGGYAWSCHLTERFKNKGLEHLEALLKSYAVFGEIKKFVDFKAVEPETLAVIEKLKRKNIKSLALTMRMFSMATGTDGDLLSANIDFSSCAIHDQEIPFDSMAGYSNGVLYAGPTMNKGECLLSFLEKINYFPEDILFVDDSKRHVDNVSAILNAKNIPNHCIRYGATDEREAKFNPAQADKDLLEVLGNDRYKSIFKELM